MGEFTQPYPACLWIKLRCKLHLQWDRKSRAVTEKGGSSERKYDSIRRRKKGGGGENECLIKETDWGKRENTTRSFLSFKEGYLSPISQSVSKIPGICVANHESRISAHCWVRTFLVSLLQASICVFTRSRSKTHKQEWEMVAQPCNAPQCCFRHSQRKCQPDSLHIPHRVYCAWDLGYVHSQTASKKTGCGIHTSWGPIYIPSLEGSSSFASKFGSHQLPHQRKYLDERERVRRQ